MKIEQELTRKEFAVNRRGISVVHTVWETLDLLGDKDKQILYLYFWKEMPQLEIAKLLDIPHEWVQIDHKQKASFLVCCEDVCNCVRLNNSATDIRGAAFLLIIFRGPFPHRTNR